MKCGNCGKEFDFGYYDREQYTYKICRHDSHGEPKMIYFCGFTCREKAKKQYREETERKRKETAEKRRATIERKKEMQNGQT